jgi:thioredoxin reductase (NADPH)
MLIIIGAGPAAYTAAIYACRAGVTPLLFEGNTPGGQLMGTSVVENWPGDISINGPELMLKIRAHAAHLGAELVQEEVISVEKEGQERTGYTVLTNDNKKYSAQAIIIATGSQARRLGCPGEELYWGRGVSTCATCDGIFYKNKRVTIVGGGDSATEMALFLLKFTQQITIVHQLDHFTGSSKVASEKVIAHPQIRTIFSSTVTEIKGHDKRVTDVLVKNLLTNKEEIVPTDGVFLAIGLTPNTQIIKNIVTCSSLGSILVTKHTKTSAPGIFAAGDACDIRYRQAITAAGAGCMAALDALAYLEELNY